MNIFITIITHRHGVDMFANATSAGADHVVANYCRDNWDHEVQWDYAKERPSPPMPIADAEVVSEYFRLVGDNEYYETIEHILGG